MTVDQDRVDRMTVDWDRVGRAVGADPELPVYEVDDLIALVSQTAERFKEDHLHNVFSVELTYRAGDAEGTVDLLLYKGTRAIIVDWKTAQECNWKWEERQRLSEQYPLYFYVTGADQCEVRGLPFTGRPKTVVIDRTPETDLQVARRLIQIRDQIKMLQATEGMWPRNKPFACRAYNRPCPYFEPTNPLACQASDEQPEVTFLTYTRTSNFQLCNERGRRDWLAAETGQEPEANIFSRRGSAVHRGLKELYLQLHPGARTDLEPRKFVGG